VGGEGFHAAVKEAFAEALGKEGPGRRAYLDELGAREPEVAAEVEELLKHHDPEDSFLESSVMDRLAEESPDAGALVGTKVGRFTITGLIASGSMGAVYEAEQEEPKRAVAVKILRAGAMSPRSIRRFRYEAEVLGLLRHPGVAQIYEAGTHDDGALTAPYFAMELVPSAKPVTRHAREAGLDPEARLALFVKICGAVHHGHQKGVIHRDVKPANILVGESGQPKVIDFGVARAVEADPGGTVGTLGGQLVGTLQYMSPEQLRPGGDDVDVRTDVYALGIVLFELVCDQPPHDLSGLSLVEAADLLRRKRAPLAGTVNRAARGDLEAVIAKATDPDRQRRYQSAEAFAVDVERFLRNEPVEASRPGLWRQLTLLARRRGKTVAAVSGVAAALVGATLVSFWFAVAAEQARESETLAKLEAERSAERATRVVTLLRDMLAVGEAGADASVAGMLDEAVVRLDEGIEEDPLVEATIRLAIGQTLHRLGRYASAERQLRAAVALREEGLGPEASATLEAAGALAQTLAERGMLGEALALAQRMTESYASSPVADPSRVASALMVRAELARRLGQPADAIERYRRAGRLLPSGSPERVEASLQRAELFLEQAKPDRAASELAALGSAASLEQRRRAERLRAESQIAREQLLEAGVALSDLAIRNRNDLGPLHAETLLAQSDALLVRALSGDGAGAAEEAGALMSSAESALESGRPVLSSLRKTHGRILQLAGEHERAVGVLRQRVTRLAASGGSDRPSVAVAALDMIEAMLELERSGGGSRTASRAAALSAEIGRTCEELFPEGSTPIARSVVLGAEAAQLMGQDLGTDMDAIGALRSARAALTYQFGAQHPLTRRAASLLGAGG